MKKLKQLFANKWFVVVAAASVVMLILFCTAMLRIVAVSGELDADKSAKAVEIALDRLNDIVRQTEGIIAEDSDFFRDKYALDRNDSDFVRVIDSVKRMRSFFPFVEEVVLYQENSQRMITTQGSITRTEFFKYAYESDTMDIEYWNSIMGMYNTPTIIPVHEYTVLSYPPSTKNLFVIPKIFSLYRLGVLIFVNEQMFWDYCGLYAAGINNRVTLYSSSGSRLISNYTNVAENIDPLLLRDGTYSHADLLGRYVQIKHLSYESMIFRFSTHNPTVPFLTVCILLFSILLTIACAYAGREAREKVLDRNYTSGTRLAELILTGTNELELPDSMQAALLETRGFITSLGSYEAARDGGEQTYRHKDSAPLKEVMEKCIFEQDMPRLCKEIKNDVAQRVKEGISFDMLAYHLLDLYITVVHSIKGGEEFYEETYPFLLNGLKRYYLSADSEKMVNVLINMFSFAKKFFETNVESKIIDILAFVDENYTQGLYLENVAEKYGMKPKYFSVFFKKHANIGFSEYVTRLKLKKATDLLVTTSTSIKEISEAVGYASSSAFVMAFKKHYKKTPNEYRNLKG
ncbi:hypothetical protein FACS189492_2620 [Clostridia bacterium]|nr:hypothetical protein FACS189492_2620 [Clostridia bacterium]